MAFLDGKFTETTSGDSRQILGKDVLNIADSIGKQFFQVNVPESITGGSSIVRFEHDPNGEDEILIKDRSVPTGSSVPFPNIKTISAGASAVLVTNMLAITNSTPQLRLYDFDFTIDITTFSGATELDLATDFEGLTTDFGADEDTNTVRSLTETITIKKRLSDDSVVEYTDAITGQKFNPFGIVTTNPIQGNVSTTYTEDELPASLKFLRDEPTSQFFWITSRQLFRIALIAKVDFTDADGKARLKGEVLFENNFGSADSFAPLGISIRGSIENSDDELLEKTPFGCFWVSCSDGFIREICILEGVPCIDIIKSTTGRLWVTYNADVI